MQGIRQIPTCQPLFVGRDLYVKAIFPDAERLYFCSAHQLPYASNQLPSSPNPVTLIPVDVTRKVNYISAQLNPVTSYASYYSSSIMWRLVHFPSSGHSKIGYTVWGLAKDQIVEYQPQPAEEYLHNSRPNTGAIGRSYLVPIRFVKLEKFFLFRYRRFADGPGVISCHELRLPNLEVNMNEVEYFMDDILGVLRLVDPTRSEVVSVSYV